MLQRDSFVYPHLAFHSGNTDRRSAKVLRGLTFALGHIADSLQMSSPTSDHHKFSFPGSDPAIICKIQKVNKNLAAIKEQADIFKDLYEKGVSFQLPCFYVLEVNINLFLLHLCSIPCSGLHVKYQSVPCLQHRRRHQRLVPPLSWSVTFDSKNQRESR